MSTQQWIFDSLFLGTTYWKASSAQWWALQKFCSGKMNDSPFHLMAGLLKVFMTVRLCLLLWGPSLGSKLPRMICPTEVIMVSRHTSPVVASFTTQLELTLNRLGLDTTPMDMVPTGISQSTSASSGVFKQVAILVKP